jgi:hypothetical protein
VIRFGISPFFVILPACFRIVRDSKCLPFGMGMWWGGEERVVPVRGTVGYSGQLQVWADPFSLVCLFFPLPHFDSHTFRNSPSFVKIIIHLADIK